MFGRYNGARCALSHFSELLRYLVPCKLVYNIYIYILVYTAAVYNLLYYVIEALKCDMRVIRHWFSVDTVQLVPSCSD